MKHTSPNSAFNQAEYVTADKKKYNHYFSFKRKDTIITSIEIIGATAIALFAAAGIYGIFS